ncbi:MAG: site-specific integrase [Planctomycetes bacterium]|nr:site-specific integrase [Planctomycetota bacterium]
MQKSVTVRGTKAEAQRKLRELLTNLDKGVPIDESKKSVGEFLDQWVRDYAETNTSPRTVEGYKGNINRYLKPKLGNIALAKLTAYHVQELYGDMIEKGLSARTVIHTHRVLSEALAYAVKWGLLAHNICESVDPPRPRKKEMIALDTGDVQKLLEATSQSLYGGIFYLAIYTGLRRSELLGLRWCDVDIPRKSISINQTVVRLIGKGLVVGQPKTKSSRRSVSLSPNAAALLSGLKAKRMEQLESVGIKLDESGFVFSNPDGGPVSPDAVSHEFQKTVKVLGLPPVRFHDLRHTHATLMLKEGIHPKIVSERLGHSTIAITMDTYSHVLPGMQEEAALVFEKSLEKSVPEAESAPL